MDKFDIDSIADTPQAEVQLKRNGQPIPLWVTMAGPEHATRRQAALAKQRKLRKQFGKSGKMELADPVDDEADELELLISSVLGWRGFSFKGQPLEFSPETVRQVLTDPARAWLRRAVREVFEDTEAFIVTSAAA